MKKVAIIGGGITGLAAAYSIKRAIDEGAEIDYVLLEKETRLGGKVKTTRTEDGFVVEGGPDCFVSTKPWIFELARKLNIEDKLICSNDELKKTYVLVNGKLRELPDGLMMMVPTKIMPFITTDLFSWPGKIRMAMDWFIPKKKTPGDETLASFVNRRLGREALDRIAEPLVAGIHAGDPDTMSLEATFPNFLEMEQKYGSVIKGMLAAMKARPGAGHGAKPGADPTRGGRPVAHRPKRTFFMSFKGGMLDIIDELYKALDKEKVLTGTEVAKIEELKGDSAQSTYRLELSDGKVVEADTVIVTSPADVAASLVSDIDKTLSGVLREIPQVSSATVSVAYRRKDLKHDLRGFGLVIPSVENRKIMAMTWSSSKWPYRVPDDNEYAVIRAFVGGAKAQERAHMKDDEMKAAVLAEVKDITGIDAEPLNMWIFRWPKGMPQYTMGHLDRLRRVDERVAAHPGLFLAGGSYRGVGMPDCVNSANKAAEEALAHLSGASKVAKV